MCHLRPILAALAPLLCTAGMAQADVFELHGGGQVRGQLINADQSPRTAYVIKTASGGVVELVAEQVKSVERQNPAEIKYDQIRSKYPDTVKGQWELAEWCRENHLSHERRKHLERIVELDPDHADARYGLGYIQNRGRWVTQEKLMTENGYQKYKGAWLLPQEIEIRERERKAKLARTEWATKLKRWRGWLNSDKAETALANIKSISDPFAAPVLAKYLSAQNEPRAVRLLFIETLGRLEEAAGMDTLVGASLYDADVEVRYASLDQVVHQDYKPAVAKYVQALRHKENPIVNRAAICLAKMKDRRAIGPLIDALVTVHSFEVPKGSGQTSASFTRGPGGTGGGGFTFGGGGTQIVRQPFQNRDVLQALVELSGTNFDYNAAAWKNWYASQKRPDLIDTRRDEVPR